MYQIKHDIEHIKQVTKYDCWHASLRMICKWKFGLSYEPSGTFTKWLYSKCRAAQNGYDYEINEIISSVENPTDADHYLANVVAKNKVRSWAQTLNLYSNGKTFHPFSNQLGLKHSLLPTILAENRLMAIYGSACISPMLSMNPEGIGDMLKSYGPLYCLLDYGHVIVISGISGHDLIVHDPVEQGISTAHIRSVEISPCVARLTC